MKSINLIVILFFCLLKTSINVYSQEAKVVEISIPDSLCNFINLDSLWLNNSYFREDSLIECTIPKGELNIYESIVYNQILLKDTFFHSRYIFKNFGTLHRYYVNTYLNGHEYLMIIYLYSNSNSKSLTRDCFDLKNLNENQFVHCFRYIAVFDLCKEFEPVFFRDSKG